MSNLEELREKLGYQKSEIPFWTIYEELLNTGEIVSPRGLKVIEIKNFQYDLPPYIRFANFDVRKLNIDYIKQEFRWYLRGDKFDTTIAEKAKLWKEMINDRGAIPSNYGQYIFFPDGNGKNQFDYVIETLLADKDSRRASISILQEANVLSGDKDLPCTYALNFRIRNNKLEMTVHMRSQDAIYGMGNDVPAFTFIQEMVYESIKPVYDGLEMGHYFHHVDSFHAYEKHFGMLFNIVKDSIFHEIEIPRINGKAEVEFLRKGDFSAIPPEFQFSQWLTSTSSQETPESKSSVKSPTEAAT